MAKCRRAKTDNPGLPAVTAPSGGDRAENQRGKPNVSAKGRSWAMARGM
jgi:hypothetical protein